MNINSVSLVTAKTGQEAYNQLNFLSNRGYLDKYLIVRTDKSGNARLEQTNLAVFAWNKLKGFLVGKRVLNKDKWQDYTDKTVVELAVVTFLNRNTNHIQQPNQEQQQQIIQLAKRAGLHQGTSGEWDIKQKDKEKHQDLKEVCNRILGRSVQSADIAQDLTSHYIGIHSETLKKSGLYNLAQGILNPTVNSEITPAQEPRVEHQDNGTDKVAEPEPLVKGSPDERPELKLGEFEIPDKLKKTLEVVGKLESEKAFEEHRDLYDPDEAEEGSSSSSSSSSSQHTLGEEASSPIGPAISAPQNNQPEQQTVVEEETHGEQLPSDEESVLEETPAPLQDEFQNVVSGSHILEQPATLTSEVEQPEQQNVKEPQTPEEPIPSDQGAASVGASAQVQVGDQGDVSPATMSEQPATPDSQVEQPEQQAVVEERTPEQPTPSDQELAPEGTPVQKEDREQGDITNANISEQPAISAPQVKQQEQPPVVAQIPEKPIISDEPAKIEQQKEGSLKDRTSSMKSYVSGVNVPKISLFALAIIGAFGALKLSNLMPRGTDTANMPSTIYPNSQLKGPSPLQEHSWVNLPQGSPSNGILGDIPNINDYLTTLGLNTSQQEQFVNTLQHPADVVPETQSEVSWDQSAKQLNDITPSPSQKSENDAEIPPLVGDQFDYSGQPVNDSATQDTSSLHVEIPNKNLTNKVTEEPMVPSVEDEGTPKGDDSNAGNQIQEETPVELPVSNLKESPNKTEEHPEGIPPLVGGEHLTDPFANASSAVSTAVNQTEESSQAEPPANNTVDNQVNVPVPQDDAVGVSSDKASLSDSANVTNQKVKGSPPPENSYFFGSFFQAMNQRLNPNYSEGAGEKREIPTPSPITEQEINKECSDSLNQLEQYASLTNPINLMTTSTKTYIDGDGETLDSVKLILDVIGELHKEGSVATGSIGLLIKDLATELRDNILPKLNELAPKAHPSMNYNDMGELDGTKKALFQDVTVGAAYNAALKILKEKIPPKLRNQFSETFSSLNQTIKENIPENIRKGEYGAYILALATSFVAAIGIGIFVKRRRSAAEFAGAPPAPLFGGPGEEAHHADEFAGVPPAPPFGVPGGEPPKVQGDYPESEGSIPKGDSKNADQKPSSSGQVDNVMNELEETLKRQRAKAPTTEELKPEEKRKKELITAKRSLREIERNSKQLEAEIKRLNDQIELKKADKASKDLGPRRLDRLTQDINRLNKESEEATTELGKLSAQKNIIEATIAELEAKQKVLTGSSEGSDSGEEPGSSSSTSMDREVKEPRPPFTTQPTSDTGVEEILLSELEDPRELESFIRGKESELVEVNKTIPRLQTEFEQQTQKAKADGTQEDESANELMPELPAELRAAKDRKRELTQQIYAANKRLSQIKGEPSNAGARFQSDSMSTETKKTDQEPVKKRLQDYIKTAEDQLSELDEIIIDIEAEIEKATHAVGEGTNGLVTQLEEDLRKVKKARDELLVLKQRANERLSQIKDEPPRVGAHLQSDSMSTETKKTGILSEPRFNKFENKELPLFEQGEDGAFYSKSTSDGLHNVTDTVKVSAKDCKIYEGPKNFINCVLVEVEDLVVGNGAYIKNEQGEIVGGCFIAESSRGYVQGSKQDVDAFFKINVNLVQKTKAELKIKEEKTANDNLDLNDDNDQPAVEGQSSSSSSSSEPTPASGQEELELKGQGGSTADRTDQPGGDEQTVRLTSEKEQEHFKLNKAHSEFNEGLELFKTQLKNIEKQLLENAGKIADPRFLKKARLVLNEQKNELIQKRDALLRKTATCEHYIAFFNQKIQDFTNKSEPSITVDDNILKELLGNAVSSSESEQSGFQGSSSSSSQSEPEVDFSGTKSISSMKMETKGYEPPISAEAGYAEKMTLEELTKLLWLPYDIETLEKDIIEESSKLKSIKNSVEVTENKDYEIQNKLIELVNNKEIAEERLKFLLEKKEKEMLTSAPENFILIEENSESLKEKAIKTYELILEKHGKDKELKFDLDKFLQIDRSFTNVKSSLEILSGVYYSLSISRRNNNMNKLNELVLDLELLVLDLEFQLKQYNIAQILEKVDLLKEWNVAFESLKSIDIEKYSQKNFREVFVLYDLGMNNLNSLEKKFKEAKDKLTPEDQLDIQKWISEAKKECTKIATTLERTSVVAKILKESIQKLEEVNALVIEAYEIKSSLDNIYSRIKTELEQNNPDSFNKDRFDQKFNEVYKEFITYYKSEISKGVNRLPELINRKVYQLTGQVTGQGSNSRFVKKIEVPEQQEYLKNVKVIIKEVKSLLSDSESEFQRDFPELNAQIIRIEESFYQNTSGEIETGDDEIGGIIEDAYQSVGAKRAGGTPVKVEKTDNDEPKKQIPATGAPQNESGKSSSSLDVEDTVPEAPPLFENNVPEAPPLFENNVPEALIGNPPIEPPRTTTKGASSQQKTKTPFAPSQQAQLPSFDLGEALRIRREQLNVLQRGGAPLEIKGGHSSASKQGGGSSLQNQMNELAKSLVIQNLQEKHTKKSESGATSGVDDSDFSDPVISMTSDVFLKKEKADLERKFSILGSDLETDYEAELAKAQLEDKEQIIARKKMAEMELREKKAYETKDLDLRQAYRVELDQYDKGPKPSSDRSEIVSRYEGLIEASKSEYNKNVQKGRQLLWAQHNQEVQPTPSSSSSDVGTMEDALRARGIMFNVDPNKKKKKKEKKEEENFDGFD